MDNVEILKACIAKSGWERCKECEYVNAKPVITCKPLLMALLENKTASENNVKIHELKILPEFFNAVQQGDKKFEIRKNDRNFHRGDILRLKEWAGDRYTGNQIDVLVKYILYSWTGGLQDGYCVMSIEPIGGNEHDK